MFWKICWAFISPLFLLAIFLLAIFTWTEHKYSGKVPYPEWAHYVGYGLVGISAVQIPLWAVLTVLYYLIRRRPSQAVKPTPKWGPGDKVRRMQDLFFCFPFWILFRKSFLINSWGKNRK